MSRRTARTARPSEQGTTQTKTPARPQRYSLVYADSPLASPSLSATRPFDWDAARGLKPPPYQTPSIPRNNRVRQSIAVGPDAHGSPSPTNLHEAGKKPRKSRVMVKTSWGKWLSSIPSQWLLRLSMLQHELPLPQPRTIGNSVGLCLHLLHALVRWLDISQMRAEEDIWMDPRGEFVFEDEDEEESGAWIQWATLLTVLLFTISIINSLFLFTRTKTYDFQLRGSESKPVPSQNASYITSPIRRAKEQESFPKDPTLGRYLHQIAMLTGRWIAHAWHFLIHHPSKNVTSVERSAERIQQLEIWDPSARELAVFEIYSPLHAMLWTLLTPANWFWICLVMCLSSFQVHWTVKSYAQALKDRALLSAEVMHEYETRFVNPRLNPIKKDACVMTSQAEMAYF